MTPKAIIYARRHSHDCGYRPMNLETMRPVRTIDEATKIDPSQVLATLEKLSIDYPWLDTEPHRVFIKDSLAHS